MSITQEIAVYLANRSFPHLGETYAIEDEIANVLGCMLIPFESGVMPCTMLLSISHKVVRAFAIDTRSFLNHMKNIATPRSAAAYCHGLRAIGSAFCTSCIYYHKTGDIGTIFFPTYSNIGTSADTLKFQNSLKKEIRDGNQRIIKEIKRFGIAADDLFSNVNPILEGYVYKWSYMSEFFQSRDESSKAVLIPTLGIPLSIILLSATWSFIATGATTLGGATTTTATGSNVARTAAGDFIENTITSGTDGAVINAVSQKAGEVAGKVTEKVVGKIASGETAKDAGMLAKATTTGGTSLTLSNLMYKLFGTDKVSASQKKSFVKEYVFRAMDEILKPMIGDSGDRLPFEVYLNRV